MPSGRGESWRRDPRAGLLVIVAGVALAGFLALVAAIVLAPSFVAFDVAVSEAMRDIDLTGLTPVAVFATRLGSFWPMAILTVGTAVVLALRGRRPEAITLLVAVIGGTVLGQLAKVLVERARPAFDLARIPPLDSYSFPSGHALSSFLYLACLAFIVLIDEQRLGRAVAVIVACVAAGFAIALSRVYLGVHYVGDIVGGWLLGSAWLSFVVLVSAYWGAGRANGE